MTKFTIVFFLLIFGITNIGLDEKPLLNTEYASIVETICEETSEPNPCAGHEIYLILKFKKRKVYITQKMVSTCEEEYVQYEFKYKWTLENNNEIRIFTKPTEIKYTSLEKLKLVIDDGIIYGIKSDGNSQSEKYIFSNKLN